MKVDLKNKVVLLSGAFGSIGRATAIKFAENGANIILCECQALFY